MVTEIKTNKWQFVFAMLGVALSWAGMAMSADSEEGKNISKAEVKDLIQKVLALIGMSLDDLMG